MSSQRPGISECFDHLWFLGEVFVLAVLDLSLVYKWLEIRTVLDAIWRVDIDHLHLASHALFFQQRVHHQQRISGDQAIRPAVSVAIKVDGFA